MRSLPRAGVSIDAALTYTWTMQSPSGVSSLDSFASAPTLPYLYVPGGQLAAQSTYTFACAVSDASSGYTGQVKPPLVQHAAQAATLAAASRLHLPGIQLAAAWHEHKGTERTAHIPSQPETCMLTEQVCTIRRQPGNAYCGPPCLLHVLQVALQSMLHQDKATQHAAYPHCHLASKSGHSD